MKPLHHNWTLPGVSSNRWKPIRLRNVGRAERTLTADSSAPAIARELVEEFATASSRGRVSEDVLDRAKLAVSELVTNAVIHGSDPGADLVVTLRCEKDNLIVDVVDRGRAAPTPADGKGGYGLIIVEEMADTFTIHRGDTWRATAAFTPRRADDA